MSTGGFSNWTLARVAEHNARLAGTPPHRSILSETASEPVRLSFQAEKKNDGKWLEQLIQVSADRYEAAGVLTLKKNEPPCRIIGSGSSRKVIFLDNPWLDFSGNWTERAARHLLVEVKSNDDKTLRIQQDNGLTTRQCKALRNWIDRGSAAMVLWGHTPSRIIRAVPAQAVFQAINHGRKHLKQDDGVPCGVMGVGLCDFAPALRRFFA